MSSRSNGRVSFICHIVVALLAIMGAALSRAAAIEGPPGFNFGDRPASGATSGSQAGVGGGRRGGGGAAGGLLGDGIDFKGGMLDWEEDEEGHRVAILRNYAVVIFPQLTISARNMVLNVEMQEIYAEGDVLFDESGGNAFYCDQLTFNYQEWKGLAKNIRIKMDREGVDLPIRDFLDSRPSTSMSNSRSLNDPGDGPPGASGSISRTQLKRMYVQAQELRAHDNETFELIDAKITPSGFARPHWYFNSPAALYRQKEKIESYHNTVRVGRWPILYFPYLIRDLQYDWPWMRVSGGRTSDYGYFVRTQWGWRLKERPGAFLQADKIIFDFDLFSRRGVGVGVETTYKAGDWDSLGKLKVYGVWEFLTSKGRDRKRAYDDNEDKIYSNRLGYKPTHYGDKFRWAVDWEHYQQLNDLWDVRAEAHLYHDRDYLKDYDPTRYWNAKEPENSIALRRLDKHWELEFVASSRLSNKWMTQADYLPEVRLTVPGMQIGDTNLFFKNDLRVGLINKRFDEDEYRYSRRPYQGRDGNWYYPNGDLFGTDPATGHSLSRLYDKDNYGAMFRAVNEMRVEAPLSLGAFKLKPWVGLRTAYYSKTLGRDYNPFTMTSAEIDTVFAHLSPQERDAIKAGVYSPHQRYKKGSGEFDVAVPLGAELSTRMYTFFGVNEQWRVITEPVVSWTENTKSRLDYYKDVYPVDSYDEYLRQRKISYELHWKLQRRSYETSSTDDVSHRDVLDFNFGIHQYPRKKDREDHNGNRRFSDLTADLIYYPFKNLSISGSLDYNTHDNTTNRAIVGVDWRVNNLVRTYATHYYYGRDAWRSTSSNQVDIANSSSSSQTHVAVRTKLWNDSSRYSLEGAVAYEWRDSNDWRNTKDGVRHGFSKYRVTLFRDMDTFEMALSYVRDRNADDHGIFFNLSPKSFMGYEKPPPGYSMEVEELADGRYSQHSRFLDDGYLIDGPVRDADIKDVQF